MCVCEHIQYLQTYECVHKTFCPLTPMRRHLWDGARNDKAVRTPVLELDFVMTFMSHM